MRSYTVWRAVAEFVEPDVRWLCWLRQVGVLRHRRDAEALVRRQLQRRMAALEDTHDKSWTLLEPSPPTRLAQLLDNNWKLRPDPVQTGLGLPPRPWQDVAHRYLGLGHYLVLSHSSMLRCYFFRHDCGGHGYEEDANYRFFRRHAGGGGDEDASHRFYGNFVPSLAAIRPLSAWQVLRHLAANHVPTDLVAGE
jgi:hypothetical protein